LNKEFFPSSHLIDIFPSHFSFHSFNKCSNNNLEDHFHQLNDIVIMSLLNHLYALVISDTGIKNNIATSITHIHVCNKLIIKTIYHAVNIILTEAKLFTIRYSINQTVNLPQISKIVVITNSIHTAKRIFDSFTNSYCCVHCCFQSSMASQLNKSTFTLYKHTQLLFLKSSGSFSLPIMTTQSLFGNVLVNATGLFSSQ